MLFGKTAIDWIHCNYQWKKYLTTLQITQFVIDLCVVYFASQSSPLAKFCVMGGSGISPLYGYQIGYTHFAMSRFSFLPNMGDCAGSESAALFGVGLLSSYLFLFIA